MINKGAPSALISGRDYDIFREFLQDNCGISLGPNKQYLVQTRIRRILAEHGIEGLGQLVDKLNLRVNSSLREQVIDAMTTNETFWFRDNYPFEELKNNIFPELSSKRGSGIRIWSAACSSGQEPYTISMTVEEFKQKNPGKLSGNIEITATDLSPSMLDMARKAEYDKLAVMRGLSAERLKQFFDEKPGDVWKIKSAVSSRVNFRPLNLQSSYSGLGKFDIIFCRNVLIYFNDELKVDILRRLHGALKPNGILFLGSSEGVTGVTELFEMVHCRPGILYRAK